MKILLFFITILICSCSSQQIILNQGSILLTNKLYDSSTKQYTNEYLFPNMKIWYRDQMVIEEIATMEENRNANGVITRKTPIAYYLFIDRNTKTFYHYSSFSDTATIIDKYYLNDTSQIKGVGGWPFYRNWDLTYVESPTLLSDTLISGVKYNRTQIPIQNSNYTVTIIAYQRCDKTNSMFQFHFKLKNPNCPITRVDYLPSDKDPTPLSSEIIFMADTLSKKETRIFNVWEKNLKKYPVNK